MRLIHKQLQKLGFDRAKATGLRDRKWVHIALILTHLRSRSRVSFRAGQNQTFEVVCVKLTINKKIDMFTFFKNFYAKIASFGNALLPFLLLAMRLFWGGTLMLGGWNKLHHIADTSNYFASLHIPFPLINAYLVGGIECGGGFCLLVGFLSQLAAIPVICVMLGALLTAHRPALLNALQDPQNLIIQSPFNYLLTALIILAIGPGIISLDYLLGKLMGTSPKAAPPKPKP